MFRRLLFTRSALVLMLAILAGLVSTWAARQHIQGRLAMLEAKARVPHVERVVAAMNLPAGTRIDTAHLAVRSYPASLVPSDSLQGDDWHRLEGRILQSALAAGDMVLPVHVRVPDTAAFSTRLLNGRRAITMPVDAINSVSGLLQPGDLIDLYVSFEYRRRRLTAPLLQGVLVLATGTSTEAVMQGTMAPGTGYSSVTLDVAPEDAVKLVAAREGGRITAVLRPPRDDAASTKASRGDLASLLGLNQASPPPAARKIPVLYGNTAIRTVPRLQRPPSQGPQPSGVFDLPYQPELSHAWARTED